MHTIEEIEKRLSEIAAELEKPEANLDALKEEVRALTDEKTRLKESAAAAEELREKISDGVGDVIEERGKDNMDKKPEEIRNSEAYMNAYAEYLKTGNDMECRSLLTENAASGGTVPVPAFLQEMIETNWSRDEILSRVQRTYIAGNIKVPFELSADEAQIHAEGGAAVTEEALTFGMVELIPEMVKKWISFSDEVVDMKGEAFLRYIYDELTYRITKKLAAEVIGDIVDAPAASSAAAIGVPEVTAAPSVVAIPTAAAHLSDEATNVVIIMNRLTEVEFLAAQAAGAFSVDPFAGLPRVYTSAIPAYSAVQAGKPYAIVGDLGGARVNYPAGDGVVIKYDDISKKKEDIVEVLGRQYAAHGVVRLGRFAKLVKPNA